jgi:hypothetical protein
LNLEDYWNLTGKEFEKHLDAYNLIRQDRIEEQDYLNYLLGHYIAVAFNNPKKYPKHPFLHKKSFNRQMSDEDMERIAQNWR